MLFFKSVYVMRRSFYLLVIFYLLSCCTSTTVVSEKEISELKSIVENSRFRFVANSANPVAFTNVSGLKNLFPPGSNQANINLTNTQNFLIAKKDSIFLDLPYFGEQQLAMAYDNNSNGLNFKGLPVDKNVKYSTSKKKFSISYNLKGKREHLNLILVLFPNKTARLDVNSSHRTSIFYYGKWKKEE